MKAYSWELTFEQFSRKTKTVNAPQYADDYYRLNVRHRIGCHYYVYLDDDLGPMNPYTKKDSGKKVFKSFCSTFSREDVLRKAYTFIIKYAKEQSLIDVA